MGKFASDPESQRIIVSGVHPICVKLSGEDSSLRSLSAQIWFFQHLQVLLPSFSSASDTLIHMLARWKKDCTEPRPWSSSHVIPCRAQVFVSVEAPGADLPGRTDGFGGQKEFSFDPTWFLHLTLLKVHFWFEGFRDV